MRIASYLVPVPATVVDARGVAVTNLKLEDFELRTERHMATLLSAASRAPIPSIRLIQAPVFHGHTISLWVEFEENPGATETSKTPKDVFPFMNSTTNEPGGSVELMSKIVPALAQCGYNGEARRQISPSHPQACMRACICSGTGACTLTGSRFL